MQYLNSKYYENLEDISQVELYNNQCRDFQYYLLLHPPPPHLVIQTTGNVKQYITYHRAVRGQQILEVWGCTIG
jgi:hypothetical protein